MQISCRVDSGNLEVIDPSNAQQLARDVLSVAAAMVGQLRDWRSG